MKVRNNKSTTDVWVGQEIAASAVYELDPTEIDRWKIEMARVGSKVQVDLGSGDLVITEQSDYSATASSDVASTTTSTAYQRKLRLTTENISAGVYRVGWSYDWGMAKTSYSFLSRIRVNSTTDISNHSEKPKDATTDVSHIGGFAYVTLAVGSHTIDIDYCTSNAGGAAKIQNARLEIWKTE